MEPTLQAHNNLSNFIQLSQEPLSGGDGLAVPDSTGAIGGESLPIPERGSSLFVLSPSPLKERGIKGVR